MTQDHQGWGPGPPPARQGPRPPDDAHTEHAQSLLNLPRRQPHLLPSTLRGTKTLNMTPPPLHTAPQGHVHMVSHNLHKLHVEAPIQQHFTQGVHVLFLQELNSSPRGELLPPGTFIHANVGHQRNGVAILGSPEIAPFLTPHRLPDNPGLLVGAQLQIPPLPPILLLSLYAGQHARPVLETLLTPILRQYPVLIAGDFNSPLCPLDVFNMHYIPWPFLNTLISTSPPSLLNAARLLHPDEPLFSRYPSPLHPHSQSLLDHFLISPQCYHLLPIRLFYIDTSHTFSDHYPIHALLTAPLFTHAPASARPDARSPAQNLRRSLLSFPPGSPPAE